MPRHGSSQMEDPFDAIEDVFRQAWANSHEDDPQADWDLEQPMLTPEASDHFDPIEDDDDLPPGATILLDEQQACINFNSRSATIPTLYCRKERFDLSETISIGWQRLIKDMCTATGTDFVEKIVVQGLVNARGDLKNRAVSESMDDVSVTLPTVGLEMAALAAAVWLIICYRAISGREPSGRCCGDRCGVLRESFWTLLDRDSNLRHQFQQDVRFWEWSLCVESQNWLHKDDWILTIERIDQFPRCQPLLTDASAQRLELAQHRRTTALARHVLEKDISNGRTPLRPLCEDKEVLQWFDKESSHLFASVHCAVLASCAQGRVARDAQTHGHPTKIELNQNLERIDMPVIYANVLCDEVGMNPTARQMKEVVALAYRYIAHDRSFDAEAVAIDSAVSQSRVWTDALTLSGYRKFTDYHRIVRKKQQQKDQARRDRIKYFLDTFSRHLQTLEAEGKLNMPLPRNLIEIGFTVDAPTRLRCHRRHYNSNYIMNLIHAILVYRFRNVFNLSQHILHVCWRAPHPWLGEILFTELCEGYTMTGFGFSHYPAGCSNGAAFRSIDLRRWHAWENWGSKRFNVLDRLQEEGNESREHYESLLKDTEQSLTIQQQEVELQRDHVADLEVQVEQLQLLNGALYAYLQLAQ